MKFYRKVCYYGQKKLADQSGCCTVDWRDGQISGFHFPHLHRIKPHVRLVLHVIAVVRLRLRDHVLAQKVAVLLKVAVRKAGANLTQKHSID